MNIDLFQRNGRKEMLPTNADFIIRTDTGFVRRMGRNSAKIAQ